MINQLKSKFMWWLAYAIPKQAALYAFVRVYSILPEGPAENGEYARAFKAWTKAYGPYESFDRLEKGDT